MHEAYNHSLGFVSRCTWPWDWRGPGGYCHTKTVGVCHQSPMEHMGREREIKKFRVTKRELLNNSSNIYKRKVSPGGTFSLGNFFFGERENYQI